MANEHPELVVTYMKSMIKVGCWANEFKRAAEVILDRLIFYRDAEDTYQGIKDFGMVPNLSRQNLACIETGKNFMLKKGYIKNDFDVQKSGPHHSSSSRPPRLELHRGTETITE